MHPGVVVGLARALMAQGRRATGGARNSGAWQETVVRRVFNCTNVSWRLSVSGARGDPVDRCGCSEWMMSTTPSRMR